MCKNDERLPERLLGDPLRLSQVLINLTTNAIKFTENGEVAVSTSLISENNGKVHVAFQVKDTGIGMTREQRKHIFQSFRQVDDSVTRTYGGTGLGLPISKQLVEMMGGAIKVKSIPGKGSTFSFDARFEVVEESGYEPMNDKHRRRENLLAIRGAKVLLVEDNPINRELAGEFLKQAGLIVEMAENGRQALEMVAQASYDLVFMDVQMPEMDGLEATRRIRARGSTDLPIVAMTAHALPGDRQRCLGAGMNDHLSKPIDEDSLTTVLIRYIPAAKRDTSADTLPCNGTMITTCVTTKLRKKLPEISDLDTMTGLGLSGGSHRLYLSVLDEFHLTYANAAKQIRDHLEAGAFKKAEILSHSIKGACAALGAEPLCNTADILEKGLAKGDLSLVEETFPLFKERLEKLCSALSQFFNRTRSGEKHRNGMETTVDRENFIHLLKQLSTLVDHGSSRAEKAAEELFAMSAEIGKENELEMILTAIKDVEFSHARELLNLLKAQLEKRGM